MFTVTYSTSYKAAKRRIQRLPALYEKSVTTYAKKWAVRLVKLFHDGVKKEEFGLLTLQDRTVAQKRRKGFDQPETPLYALGDRDKRHSYANMMRVHKDGKVWRVRPHNNRLKGKDFTFRQLFMVHEYGVTIRNGFGRGILIRIPPRPAMKAAYRTLLADMGRADPVDEVRRAIIDMIVRADERGLKRLGAKEADTDRYDEK